ncbi:MAG: RNA-binding protein [Candidatus Bathyarchaeota archaeon]|nr:RNA-binding protein [Candidatus Bathyarchaeota archaeon]
MGRKKLAVAIPASVISDTPHLREKTAKIGLIGRAAAIFRVDEIIVYRDERQANQQQQADLIATLLQYMEMPQYLRKRLFKLDPRLKYAGIIPPLRTPHHPLNKKAANLKIGEYREGVVTATTPDGVLVDVGVEAPALLREKHLAVGKRLTVKIARVDGQVEVQTANRAEIPCYWGYEVTQAMENKALAELSEKFNLKIATSKKGAKFTYVAEKIAQRWKKANSILLLFGSPKKGLYELANEWKINLGDLADFVVNTIPEQGTETVRTEEALLATLAVLNVQFSV